MKTYLVLARYSDDGGYWIDQVEAESIEGAEIAARAIMAENGDSDSDAIEIVSCEEVDESAERVRDAAPALLAALEYIASMTLEDLTRHAARAAIAQATGGQPAPTDPRTAIITEALDAWREEFDDDTPIDGADLLDWFAGWRERAKAAIGGIPKPVRIRVTVEGGLVQCVDTLTGDPAPIIAEVWDFDVDGMDADETEALPVNGDGDRYSVSEYDLREPQA